MPDTPSIITSLCDADNYTKYGVAQVGRNVFTVAEFEEMNEGGMKI